ncbi:hypothetical protein RI367_007909 [Sorochytrium milnesiophthora]
MSTQPPTQFNFDSPPAFSPSQYLLVTVLMLTFGTGAILNGFLGYVLLKNKRSFTNNVNLMLTTLLNLADSITPTILTFYQFAKLVFGRYALGYWGCQVFVGLSMRSARELTIGQQSEAAFISAGVNWSLFAVILIAVERYCVVVREVRKPWVVWRWPAFFAGFLGILLAIDSLIGLDTPYVVQPSGVYCMDDLNNVPEVSRGNQTLYLTLFPTILTTIAGVYFCIYRHVSTITQATKTAMDNSAKGQVSLRSMPMAPEPIATAPVDSVGGGNAAAIESKTSQTSSRPFGAAANKMDSTLSQVQNTRRPSTVTTFMQKVRYLKSSATAKQVESSGRAEQQAFKTSVGITACFFVMLIPYLVNLALLTAGYNTPPWCDGVTAFFGITNLLSDAVVMYSLNPRVRKMVKDELSRLRGRVFGGVVSRA